MPNQSLTIAIDAGHGLGNRRLDVDDPGAVSKGIKEKDIAWNFALTLIHIGKDRGHKMVLTRTHNRPPGQGEKNFPVSSRAKIAEAADADVLISLHCNASVNPLAKGVEVYFRSSANEVLAGRIQRALVAVTGQKNRGVKHESQSQHKSLAVLNFHTAVLIELGFITHGPTREQLQQRPTRIAVASAILDQLEEHFA